MVYLSLIVQELVLHAILSKHVEDNFGNAEIVGMLYTPLVVAELTEQ